MRTGVGQQTDAAAGAVCSFREVGGNVREAARAVRPGSETGPAADTARPRTPVAALTTAVPRRALVRTASSTMLFHVAAVLALSALLPLPTAVAGPEAATAATVRPTDRATVALPPAAETSRPAAKDGGSAAARPELGRWVQTLTTARKSSGNGTKKAVTPAGTATARRTTALADGPTSLGRIIANVLYAVSWSTGRASPECARHVRAYNEHVRNSTLWATKSE